MTSGVVLLLETTRRILPPLYPLEFPKIAEEKPEMRFTLSGTTTSISLFEQYVPNGKYTSDLPLAKAGSSPDISQNDFATTGALSELDPVYVGVSATSSFKLPLPRFPVRVCGVPTRCSAIDPVVMTGCLPVESSRVAA